MANRFLEAALIACLLSASSLQAQTPQGSTTIPGNADSVLVNLVASMTKEACRVRRTDRPKRTVTATCSGADEELVFQVRQVGDSVTLSAQGRQGGVAAMIVGLSVIQRFINPPPAGAVRRMASGDDWAQDEAGRVGFLVLSAEGRRFAKAAKADTAWEVRPGQLPAGLREEWEDGVNRAGFDASCARVFRVGDLFLLRWNKCATPIPDLDRFEVYGADGSWEGTAVGPSIADMISVMCPVSRSGSGAVGDARCPAPWSR